jgi:NTP pyrophosphatase (non-canonical NTP hydrolase)
MNGRGCQLKDKTYHGQVVEILDNGDAILELPDDLVEDMGWYEGTKLNISMENGAIILKKLNTDMNQDVNTFIDACDQLPSKENVSLYRNLINEEFWEFQDAIKANDEVEQLDACMDMIWVILGYCKMKGYDVDGAWTEVARSNLAKIDINTGKVIKRADGKVLKPEGWTAPVLAPFVKV